MAFKLVFTFSSDKYLEVVLLDHIILFPIVTSPIHNPINSGWASLIAQLIKNPPAMQETLVQFLGQEDPLAKG